MTAHTNETPSNNPQIPEHIAGLEHVIEAIGVPVLAQAIGIGGELTTKDIRQKLIRIEAGTIVSFPEPEGTTPDLFDRLGRDLVTSAMEIPPTTDDIGLRAAILELERRSLVRDLGLEHSATIQEAYAERDRRGPSSETDEELAIALRRADKIKASIENLPAVHVPEHQPGESLENWRTRTQF